MPVRKLISVLLLLLCAACLVCGAQSPDKPSLRLKPISPVAGGLDRMLTPKMDAESSLPHDYKGYTDEDLRELEEAMKERDWSREDTAWMRACEIDSQASYARYMAMYPSGEHFPQASARLIEAKVSETLANAHEDLPQIERTKPDDDSPTSTLVIRNHTGMSLTVYCSGTNSKSVVIAPDAREFITVENGSYKIAATVPPVHVRPYAGMTYLGGGQYEVGFWIVSR